MPEMPHAGEHHGDAGLGAPAWRWSINGVHAGPVVMENKGIVWRFRQVALSRLTP
jgi:hypothetical protein